MSSDWTQVISRVNSVVAGPSFSRLIVLQVMDALRNFVIENFVTGFQESAELSPIHPMVSEDLRSVKLRIRISLRNSL